jgi:hypothetical protein
VELVGLGAQAALSKAAYRKSGVAVASPAWRYFDIDSNVSVYRIDGQTSSLREAALP